jgi:serine/threonine protein kinase
MHDDDTLIFDPLDKPPESGDLVQGYRLGELLGRGAHGRVFRATKDGEPAEYAVKLVDIRDQPQHFTDRILRECAITTKLRHPGIILVHESGFWGSCIFIVMEVAQGQAGDQFAHGGLGWPLAVSVAYRAAEALGYAWDTARVIHRDIKPANLVIDFAGDHLRGVQVVDFGLGRIAEEAGDGLTMTGMVLGTPFYMSPEQARGERDITCATDIYALGATLFAMVAGRPPFVGGTPIEIILAHCNESPPRLDTLVANCPPALADLVDRCLAKEPAGRFAGYPELLNALDRVRSGASVEQQETIEAPEQVRAGFIYRALRETPPTVQAVPQPQRSDRQPQFRKQVVQPFTGIAGLRKKTQAKPSRRRPPSVEPGVVIDGIFTVGGPIGAGGMGEIFAVTEAITNRRLALKILSAEDMGRPGMVTRFRGECQALATIEHPSFPYFAGKGTYEERDYLLMELVDGIDLKTWLEINGGRMAEAGALGVIGQLAAAMDRAHSRCGMIHRDIKPANLMFAKGPRPVLKIVDFGVSTYIDYGDFEDFSEREYHYIDDDSRGRAVGTPAYMSPEQCVGAPPTPLMDVYAIGCTFFQLVTGRTPYLAPSSSAMMMKHMQDPPPEFTGIIEVSNGSQYLLKRLMAKNPRDRFRNFRQIVAAVDSARFSLTTRIRLPGAG